MFYNRKNELDVLNAEYGRAGAVFTIIYGRRRIGKTSLISEYIKDKPAIYYYATEVNMMNQLDQLTDQIIRFFGKGYLENIRFKDFEQLFVFLAEQLSDQKLVLVIDEYQQLVKLDRAISSVIQKCWDIVLCGSIISMMHSETLEYSSPLYGRRTSAIHLKGLNFCHIKDFAPDISKLDQMNVYASLGTVPKYLELYHCADSFAVNIQKQILDKNSYLYNEVRFLLNEEIKDTATYFTILETIAAGDSKIGKIGSKLNVPSHYLTRYLLRLGDLDIIEKEVPITEKEPPKSKLGRYRIKDAFIKFWFYYVYRNYSLLEIGKLDFVIEELERSFNEKFVSSAFEYYVKEVILDDPETYIGFKPLKIGRWWTNKEEIDLVAFNDDQMAFIECKWQNKKVGYETYADLRRKSELVTDRKDLKKVFVIFAKEGVKESLKDADCRWFSYL